jgi:hypothetical protein
MLDHLLGEVSTNAPDVYDDPVVGFTPLEKASPSQVLAAQVETGNFLQSLGVEDDDAVAASAQVASAQEAFRGLIADQDDPKAKNKLLRVQTPQAVRHLVGMLTAYDWEFVEQAKELRGYAVSKIVEETGHPDAKIRLRALELLGKVTEVGLFTERIEVKKTDISDAEIDAKLMEKLTALRLIEDVEERKKDATDAEVVGDAE